MYNHLCIEFHSLLGIIGAADIQAQERQNYLQCNTRLNFDKELILEII